MVAKADVIINAVLVDDLGTIGPCPYLLIEAKPIGYPRETVRSITNENGTATLKLLLNREYELSYSYGNATYSKRVNIDSSRKEIKLKLRTHEYHRLKINVYLEHEELIESTQPAYPGCRKIADYLKKSPQESPRLLIMLYDPEDNSLIAKGYTDEIINLSKPLKPGSQIIVRIYPIDPEGHYLEEWHNRLKSFIISKGEDISIKLDRQEVSISIPATSEQTDKCLKIKFRDLLSEGSEILQRLKGVVREFSSSERKPEVTSVSFSEYLGWGEKNKVMALFGGKGGEDLHLYKHQLEALKRLEESGSKRLCLILASGMASGKTEVAILYLLKTFRNLKAVKPGGHVVVVYPTRELLRNQYIRWKIYFDGAYDLGYLPLRVEVVKLYGELAAHKPMEYEMGRRKLERSPCVVLTTASTLFGWANDLDEVLNNTIPSVILFDEIHFYTAFDLTLLMELLGHMLIKYGNRLNKILMFSATVGGLREFATNVERFLEVKTVPIRGESLQGPKTIYSIDISREDGRQQEIVINEILRRYAEGAKKELKKDKIVALDKTIIFAKDRSEAESIYNRLGRSFRKIACLHLGDMDELERRKSASEFMLGKRRVIITVKTLEVGIDIGDASRVIHLSLPPSLNEFIQREGRVGRRGQECESIVILRDSGEVKRFDEWVKGLGYKPIEHRPTHFSYNYLLPYG